MELIACGEKCLLFTDRSFAEYFNCKVVCTRSELFAKRFVCGLTCLLCERLAPVGWKYSTRLSE